MEWTLKQNDKNVSYKSVAHKQVRKHISFWGANLFFFSVLKTNEEKLF